MDKSPHAFRTIGEVAQWLETPAHVLRFWESRFPEIAPVKRAGGRRYYRPEDMRLIAGIKHLLHTEGHTIKSVQERLKTEGVAAIGALSDCALPGKEDADAAVLEAEAPEAAAPQAAPEHDSEIPPIGFFFDDSADADPAEAQSGTFAQTAPQAPPAAEAAPPAEASSADDTPASDAGAAEPRALPDPGHAPAMDLSHVPADPGDDDALAGDPVSVAARLRALDPAGLGADEVAALRTLHDRIRGARAGDTKNPAP